MPKFIVGRRYVNVDLSEDDNRIYLKFKFNRTLINEIKAMAGARWHPDDKMWSVLNNTRNRFNLEYLQGRNPYERWDAPLLVVNPERPVYDVQRDMISHGLTRRECIIAAEMGLGKTLAAIEIMERSGKGYWWFVAPKNTLTAIDIELRNWGAKVRPTLMTYERMVKTVENWTDDAPAPEGIVFDEAQYLKNPKAKRTQFAMHITESMRQDHQDPYVILMSGTPAPKSPLDWWTLCEIACPGFLKEGDYFKFKKTLAVVVERESLAGGIYPHIVSWRSSDKVCNKCGELDTHSIHSEIELATGAGHSFEPSVNEVSRLYSRMKGLVLVKFKKDSLDLPEKVYKRIVLEPSRSVLNAARLIEKTGGSAANVLVLLRELSDGFQYVEEEDGFQVCPGCHGTGKQIIVEPDDDPGVETVPSEVCAKCNGELRVPKLRRTYKRIPSPKTDALREQLEMHEDIGRLVTYCGFQASVDLCVEIGREMGWNIIQIDGRGVKSDYDRPLEVFQSDCEDRILFVGHPGSGGTGLTLTKSPTIVYYSNSFNAAERMQSEDRIHRIGMDSNRGATIIDFIHLPTDQLVLDNLKIKRDLQSVSMGELAEALSAGIL